MDTRAHWEHLYGIKSPREMSWHEPHLRTSLDWISAAATSRSAAIIDVGGGDSTLVDDLQAAGYHALTVLDVSETAIKRSQERLGPAAQSVTWFVAEATTAVLPARAYDVWHDRAVFHFLTEPTQRAAYVHQLVSALKPGGQVIMSTFGPDGPQRCSGLDVMRYDAASLLRKMGPSFRLVRSSLVEHRTPFETAQQFLYCHFSFDPSQKGASS